MSKFVEIAISNSKEETTKQQAESVQPILKARIEARIKAQEAEIIECKIFLEQAEEHVIVARGYVTKNAEEYIQNVFDVMTNRDTFAADLEEAETLLTELADIVKVFA